MTAEWKDIFTSGLAALGAVLGVMNTWNSISARRLRVKVTPDFLYDLTGKPIGASIEVTNLSSFPISLAEVGFEVRGGGHIPVMQTRVSLPRRMDSRDSASIHIYPGELLPPPGKKIGSAYARTACGNRIRGNSPAGRQLSSILASISGKAT